MNPQEINGRIAQAKSRYNASKGQADGLLHDAQTLFVNSIIGIIDSQLTEIAHLKAPKKERAQQGELRTQDAKKIK